MDRREPPKHDVAPGPRLALLLALAAGCFAGDELRGQPCRTDADCNPRPGVGGEPLECQHEVCGYEARCGDGVLDEQAREQCDDANQTDGDGCSQQCLLETCGDGVAQGAEECDDGNDINTDACVQCRLARCNDGVTQQGVEQCDDGNADETDACLSNCLPNTCGDGFVWLGYEDCDDGNADVTGACPNACTAAACGDGFTWAGVEQCDDANQIDEDPCLRSCLLNTCGDGFLEPATEGCDDGNDERNDGCADCRRSAEAIDMGAESEHVCAVRDGGVRCWGHNWDGQLGIGTATDLGDEPGELPGEDILAADPGTQVVKVTAGGQFTCVLLSSKAVRCWGWAGYGQLGDGSVGVTVGDDPGELPSALAQIGGDVADVAAGFKHACALLTSGSVRCWGANPALGYPAPAMPELQTPASNGDVALGGRATRIAVGSDHSCALLEDGGVRCWGSNQSGQLGYPGVALVGDDETPGSMGPVDVGGSVVHLAAGGSRTCAVLAGGADMRCWGYGEQGELGNKSSERIGDDETPAAGGVVQMLVPGDIVAEVAIGRQHTCVLLTNGTIRCWGAGGGGQLGYENSENLGGSANDSPPGPVPVGGIARDVVAGTASTCALLDGGAIRCWGFNFYGQLGVNDTNDIGDAPGTMPPRDAQIYENP